MSKFTDLKLIKPLLKNLEVLGHETPTAIQFEAIPFILEGKDLLGMAQTGTGKTAAFCLPILQLLHQRSEKSGIRSLILAPTRELASQIHLNLDKYGQDVGLKTLAQYGGVDQRPQVKALREGVDILVSTPGRLLDLMEQGHVRLNRVEIFVLDEADQMLDMGFIDDIYKIVQSLPKERQTLFFSATMPLAVVELSKKILKNPQRVEVSPNSSTVLNVEQKIIFCKREDKFQLLRKILAKEERELVVVFTKTRNSADKVKEYLRAYRLASTVIHGDKSQEDREKALINFKNGSMKILIATDIAARGIDIQGISHVINFEMPLEAENYVHRVGRTARAGKEGTAISFCDESEKNILEKVQKLIQLNLPSETYKGTPEASGIWSQEGPIQTVKAPTPGRSQEKSIYIDHSKRQKVAVGEKSKAKSHPGFKNKKKKK
jgi:ATP-dependent RNA helicase RhlE